MTLNYGTMSPMAADSKLAGWLIPPVCRQGTAVMVGLVPAIHAVQVPDLYEEWQLIIEAEGTVFYATATATRAKRALPASRESACGQSA